MAVPMDVIRQARRDLRVEVWRAEALCLEYPDVEWFPGRDAPATEARAICDRCRVQQECLDYALHSEHTLAYGIWGGTGPNERRALRRRVA
jgi:WhiB family redox-sensing transcriptional regulator